MQASKLHLSRFLLLLLLHVVDRAATSKPKIRPIGGFIISGPAETISSSSLLLSSDNEPPRSSRGASGGTTALAESNHHTNFPNGSQASPSKSSGSSASRGATETSNGTSQAREALIGSISLTSGRNKSSSSSSPVQQHGGGQVESLELSFTLRATVKPDTPRSIVMSGSGANGGLTTQRELRQDSID